MNLALNQFLKHSNKLGDNSVDQLLEVWKKHKIIKVKELLLDFNQLESNLYFVKEGCVRLFVIDKNGEQITMGFAYENSLITCFQTFIEGKPSSISIEAVLDTELVAVNKTDLMQLIHRNSEIALWYQSMLEITLTGHIQRQVELLTLKPQERYAVFMSRSGHLLNRIPLKLIASYLMMKPETLSRIRAKIS
ncbi:Crp/Fnr family transcriptional regulator [Flavobacterium sp. FBOR7N2.3]|uniref:Crp/Fnr family transcriptional regulator n=1 Tax=Flavobacterium magnesitis TaxID=3138077 RepID=A0ABV4TLB8_9FLAO